MKLNAKGIHVYLILLASVLALITVCLGATRQAMTTNANFSTPLILVMAAGILCGVLNLFSRVDFLPLVASVLFSAGFGMIFDQGLPVVVDRLNNITFQGGDFTQVVLYLSLMAAACLLSIVSCFMKKKAEKAM